MLIWCLTISKLTIISSINITNPEESPAVAAICFGIIWIQDEKTNGRTAVSND